MSFRKNISMGLSSESIDQAIREVRDFRRKLEKCCNDLIRELTDQGVIVAKMNVMSMNAVLTGQLEESISGIFNARNRVGVIYTTVPYAVYVEYGTGIVGEASPNDNPEGEIEWSYDINNHGDKGWWYYATIDGKSGFHWTKGMPARPFMYNTLRWLQQNAPDVAARMFGNM